ncbi:MAG: PAS domain S-box protein, partial [Phototrophicaceae bacterium]
MDQQSSNTDLQARIVALEQEIEVLKQQQHHNQFAQDILQSIPDGLVIIRLSDKIIVDANTAMTPLFGYDTEELIGSELPALTTDRNFYDYIIQKTQQNTSWHEEILTTNKQGNQFSCNVDVMKTSHPIHNDVIVIIFHNIEEKYVYRNQYLSLVDTLPNPIYRVNLDGKITFVNKAFQQAIDIPFTQIIGQKLHEIYPYIAADDIIQDDQRVIAKGSQDYQIQSLLNPQTGNIVHLSLTKVPIKDDNSKIVGIQGIIEDITARTQVENQLKASQGMLQRLIQQIPIGIQVFDKSALCIDANQAHLEIFGKSYGEIVGQYNIFNDKLATKTATAHAAKLALQGDTVMVGDLEFDFHDGDERFANIRQQTRIINVTIFPMFDHDDHVTGFVGLNIDVTHTKRRQEQLRLSEARYRAIVQDQNEMISRYLPDGTITFANRAFCDLVKKSHDELIGSKWQTLVSDEAQQEIQAAIDAITQDQPTIFREEQQQTEDGEIRWIHWIDRGIFNVEGDIVEYQGIGIDITQQKQLEQEQFLLALEQERMKILSDFVIQASHEFRTPLSIINSSAFAMTRMADVKQREARLLKINKQVQQMTQLIESMTLMSRIDSERDIRQQNLVDINKLMEIAYEGIQGKVSDETASMHLSRSDTPLMVNIVSKDFVRVIELITDNALKYTSADDRIDMITSAQDEQVIITIIDTGEGMSAETSAHVFERFFKADTSGKSIGLGLGLPIARGIVRQFGGTINLESDLGEGTTVTITFPQVE